MDENNKLGRNIKGLRNAHGQTLLELAEDIGVDKSAISQYENGKRIPSRDILARIAKHFNVTENELLYSDYSHMKDFTKAPINNKVYVRAMIDKMLPITYSQESASNLDFAKAYDYHLKLYDDIVQGGVKLDEHKYEACIKLYEKASENGVLEATANLLWWMIFGGLVYTSYTPRLAAHIEMFGYRKITMKQIFEKILFVHEDEKDEEYAEFNKAKTEFIQDIYVDLLVNIGLLKKSEKYVALGDYYLALCYILSLIHNDKSSELNRSIGYEMMHIFKVLGNQYAKNFVSPTETEDIK